jgi:hypothetical protein
MNTIRMTRIVTTMPTRIRFAASLQDKKPPSELASRLRALTGCAHGSYRFRICPICLNEVFSPESTSSICKKGYSEAEFGERNVK